MMKDIGKTWDAFWVVSDRLVVKVLRYTKVMVTRFQAHVQWGLSNFLKNFGACYYLQRMLWNRVWALTR